ncbi:unnamed protein product, partial [Brassica rapa subsp. trilocularis]
SYRPETKVRRRRRCLIITSRLLDSSLVYAIAPPRQALWSSILGSTCCIHHSSYSPCYLTLLRDLLLTADSRLRQSAMANFSTMGSPSRCLIRRTSNTSTSFHRAQLHRRCHPESSSLGFSGSRAQRQWIIFS